MSNKNYNKISTEKAKGFDEVIEEIAEEAAKEALDEIAEEVEEALEYFEGVVSDCSKLNVRANPDTCAKVECVIDEGANVVIFPDKSTDEWFNVATEAGVEGYCMKKFISIKE